MPPIAYALASDTLIGVVRAWALARHQQLTPALAGETSNAGRDRRPDFVATAAGPGPGLHPGPVPGLGARGVPGRPGRRAARPARPSAPARLGQGEETVPRKATQTARFLYLVTASGLGPKAAVPLDPRSPPTRCRAWAAAADLNPGAARAALRKAVLSARNGDPS